MYRSWLPSRRKTFPLWPDVYLFRWCILHHCCRYFKWKNDIMDVIPLTLKFPQSHLVHDTPLPIHATCPIHLILHNFIAWTMLGEQYRSLSSSSCTFLHSHVTSSLLGPNNLLITLFSHTLSLRSSLKTKNLVSHPYETKGKIIFLYIWIFHKTWTHNKSSSWYDT